MEREFSALPSMSDLSLSWEQRYAPRRDLANRYPQDWSLQFKLQQPILQHSELRREWDLALAHYRALADRQLGELLEARLLSQLYPKKSRQVIERVLAEVPDSPWTHLAALEWAADRQNGDPALAAQEFEAFHRRCPGDVRVYQYLGFVRDPQKLRGHVTELRNAIETRKKQGFDEYDVGLFRTAWTWELVTYGERRLDDYKRAVRADLEFLHKHLNPDSATWVFMVSFGYKDVLQDATPIKAIDDEVLSRAPNGQAAWEIRKARWEEQNPAPKASAPQPGQPLPREEMAAEEAYAKLRNEFMVSLIEQFRDTPDAADEAAEIMTAQDLPDSTFEWLADLVLSKAERLPDHGTSSPPVQIQVAEEYVRRKVRLDRVPELVQRGLAQAEDQEKYYRETEAFARMTRVYGRDDSVQRRAREILIRHAIVTQQKERAITMLSEWQRELDRSKPAEKTGRAAREWQSRQMNYSMLAREAGLQVPMDDLSAFRTPEQPDLYPVEEFEAKDLSGKTWTLADLRGKVTFVLLWRTGCPCNDVLDGMQKLHERWKGRVDRAVLTISQDESPAIAESFMKENEYSFPVICSVGVSEKFVPGGGYPRAFFVDPQGRRSERRPRGEQTLDNIDDMADQLAK
ncbi:MAG TPA: TlpA disulfide reductase family protein [Bryobacteraceae bacterium]|nr:TlpA disulfide reductase family protein [Bryobacteraceae bacterium]